MTIDSDGREVNIRPLDGKIRNSLVVRAAENLTDYMVMFLANIAALPFRQVCRVSR